MSKAGSPTAPNRMASASRAAASVSPGSGGKVLTKRRRSNQGLVQVELMTEPRRDGGEDAAPATTSGPTPSPGNKRIEAFIGIYSEAYAGAV